MPINKNAILRYHALDKCFSNFGRRYYIEDLVDACNEAIYNFTGVENGIKKRQIFVDINFMESPEGWEIPLDRIKDGKRVFYRYYDKSFSIKKQPINELEAVQINSTLMLLERFKGLPHFEWIEELSVRMNSALNLKKGSSQIVDFENNPYLKGLNYFQEIFNYIYYERVIEVNYKPFTRSDTLNFIISPYFLKQYNSRWYLFGYNHEYNDITTIPLDRIESIQELKLSFIKNEIFNPEDYFEDIVGVTTLKESQLEKVVLQVSNSRWDYIDTKPLHGSQKIIGKTDDFVTIELELKINKELVSLIFSFGSEIKVLSPKHLIETIKVKALSTYNTYT